MARTETRPLKFEPLASARGSTCRRPPPVKTLTSGRSEEHTSELQSRSDLVCRLLLEKKKAYVDSCPTSLPSTAPPRAVSPTTRHAPIPLPQPPPRPPLPQQSPPWPAPARPPYIRSTH